MNDLNVFNFSGRLVADMEVRQNTRGSNFGSYTVAVNRSYTVEGQKKEEAAFIDCTLPSSLCSAVVPYMKKGVRVIVSGYVYQSRYEKDGKKMSRSYVGTDKIQILDFPQTESKEDISASVMPKDEDIPF